MKTLYLEKRGCDFWHDEKIESDIGNYRVTTTDYTIEGKNRKKYFLEFSLWRNRGHYRTTTKNGKRTLKKPVFEIDIPNGLSINTEFDEKDINGVLCSWRDLKIEKQLHKKMLTYTKKDILRAVNYISKDKYTKIEFV